MHPNNQFIRQLPNKYKSKHAHIIFVVSQLTYLTLFKKKICKYLLTSHTRLNPPTWLRSTITKYNTPLHIVLEGPYEENTRPFLTKGLLNSKVHVNEA
jgi:hypothetical protein